MTLPPRVALAGFYGHGNFGDDLMAVGIGQFLESIGVPFAVYRLCKPHADKYGLTVKHTAEELLGDADVLLWGGGGVLVSWPRLTYNILFPNAAKDLDRVIGLAIQQEKRILGVSVGGDGTLPRELAPGYKQRFVQAAEYLTVRNPEDLRLLEQFGTEGSYFPDIVWQASKWFPVRRTKADRMRIGMDIYAGNLIRKNAVDMLPRLYALTRERKDCEFIFIDATNRASKPYRGLGLVIRGKNVRSYQFGDMEEDLNLLGSLDLLVSTRLHVPMAGMQYGVPTISLFGEEKTTLMFRNLGLERICYGRGRAEEFLGLMRDRSRMDAFIQGFVFPDIAALQAESEGHLQFLRERLCGEQGR